jgi:hypothetical protein
VKGAIYSEAEYEASVEQDETIRAKIGQGKKVEP